MSEAPGDCGSPACVSGGTCTTGEPEVRGQPLTPAVPCRVSLPPSQEAGELVPFREDAGVEAGSGLQAREVLLRPWVLPFSGEGAIGPQAPSLLPAEPV